MAIGGWRTRTREAAFDHYCASIKEALNQYTRDPERKEKNDWKEAASTFKDCVLPVLAETKSLIALHKALYDFSESLRSTYNYVTSSIFGESFTEALGSYVGAKGSGLKAELEIILESIEPYHPRYICENLFQIRLSLRLEKVAQHIYYYDEGEFDYIANLSPESIKVLTHVISSEEKLEDFKLKARGLTWAIPVQDLLDKFKQKYATPSEEKPRTGYFF